MLLQGWDSPDHASCHVTPFGGCRVQQRVQAQTSPDDRSWSGLQFAIESLPVLVDPSFRSPGLSYEMLRYGMNLINTQFALSAEVKM